MSWAYNEYKYGWLEWIALQVLKCGSIPSHLALIMDGNRRYAKQHSLEKIQGHRKGFEKMATVLQWCRDIGITEVTVFAFSIENFKRTKEEVDGLMNLTREKFNKLLEEVPKLKELGVCIRAIGKLDMLPSDVQCLISKAVLATQENKPFILNIAIAYSSREEMANAVRCLGSGIEKGLIEPGDTSEWLFERCLYTGYSPPPNLLVRTSGEVRLSDFLLWQSSYSCIFFQNVLWPDFSLWNLLAAVYQYQKHISKAKKQNIPLPTRTCPSPFDTETDVAKLDRVSNFLKFLDEARSSYHRKAAAYEDDSGQQCSADVVP